MRGVELFVHRLAEKALLGGDYDSYNQLTSLAVTDLSSEAGREAIRVAVRWGINDGVGGEFGLSDEGFLRLTTLFGRTHFGVLQEQEQLLTEYLHEIDQALKGKQSISRDYLLAVVIDASKQRGLAEEVLAAGVLLWCAW